MINTIFYFPDTLPFETYKELVDAGQISPQTIVFVKDTKTIYMGGKQYCHYDDSQVRELINTLNSLLEQARTTLNNRIDEVNADLSSVSSLAAEQRQRLNELLAGLDTDIQEKIESLLDDAEWIQTNWPQGVTQWLSGWNEDIEAYLQLVGVWARDNDVTRTNWSTFTLKVDNLELAVNGVKTQDDQSLVEALQARIGLAIDNYDETATAEIATTYAKVDDLDKVIEWMYSGLKSSSSAERTYNEIVSAAKNDELGLSAIADVYTTIENLGDTYVARAGFDAMVGDSLASIIEEVKEGSSITTMINQIDDNANNISAISSRVYELEGGGYISESFMLNSLENELDGTTTKSEIKSKVDNNAKTAAYSLFAGVANADNNVTAASIVDAIVNESGALTTLGSYFKSADAWPNSEGDIEVVVTNTLNASVDGGSWTAYVAGISDSISAFSLIEGRVLALEDAGFVTSTTVGSMILDNVFGSTQWAGLIATVDSLGNTQAELSASISDLDGNVVKKASVIASINASGESNVKIDADKINITGPTIIGLINSDNTTTIDGGKITANSITVNAANVTGQLTANQIDATNLQVAAANITGTLNANLIDATNLHVNAANIDGTITVGVDASDVTGLNDAIDGRIGVTTISGDQITTGTINTDRLNVSSIINAASANIDTIITNKLEGGSATFKGNVEASLFIAGSSTGFNVTTSENTISFNNGDESRAYFTSENSGMQLYIKDPIEGEWHKLDFNNMSEGTSYPANSVWLYKLLNGSASQSIVAEYKKVYYQTTLSGNRYGTCFVDEYGTTVATNDNMGSGWYIYSGTFRAPYEDMIVQDEEDSNKYELYRLNFADYCSVSFDNRGIMTEDTSIVITATDTDVHSDASDELYRLILPGNYVTNENTSASVNSDNIYCETYNWNTNEYVYIPITDMNDFDGRQQGLNYTYVCNNSYVIYKVYKTKTMSYLSHWTEGKWNKSTADSSMYLFDVTNR